jgi:hypothetical protein
MQPYSATGLVVGDLIEIVEKQNEHIALHMLDERGTGIQSRSRG